MPLIPPSAPGQDLAWLRDLRPAQVLDEDLVVRLWVVQTGLGQPMLAYLADETPTGDWVLLSATSEARIRSLEAGQLPLRDALTEGWLWLVLRPHQGPLLAWPVQAQDLPPDHLPRPGVRLRLEHTPVLTTRAVGPTLVAGQVPASVVAWVADATRMAMKALVEHLGGLDTGGRPTDEARARYDLPVRTLAFGSLEIGFGLPSGAGVDTAPAALALLQAGLRWLSADAGTPLLPERPHAERLAVLEALKRLSPPDRGAIEALEIGGAGLQKSTRLDPSVRQRLAQERRAVQSERPVTAEGRIGGMDQDRHTFVLRDLAPGQAEKELRWSYGPDLQAAVLGAFTRQAQVTITGSERSGRLYARTLT